ncbi:hypothetical protein [Metamycoplasma buccale]|uniref:hypothetical protein n=1 Tax=Metamycoplasma buccale TaxID=55602 RepID=UPI00398F24E0
MKDIISKRFWVLVVVLNIITTLIYIGCSVWKYQLLLGNLIGIISFLIFIFVIKLIFKIVFAKKENKSVKWVKGVAIILILLTTFFNLLFILMIFGFNYLYKTHIDVNGNLAFNLFNIITFTTPYLVFTIACVIESIWQIKDQRKGKING